MNRTHRRRLRLEMLETRRQLAGDTLHNFLAPLDVNDDGRVEPIDALVILNRINRGGVADPVSQARQFFDVNDDGVVAPIDALRIINALNRQEEVDPLPTTVGRVASATGVRSATRLTRTDAGVEFEVRVQNAGPAQSLPIYLEDRWVGSLVTDNVGRGRLLLKPDNGLDGVLPELLIEEAPRARIKVGDELPLEVEVSTELGEDDHTLPADSPALNLLRQTTVLTASLFSDGQRRGEAIYVQRNGLQFLGVYLRGLAAGETVELSVNDQAIGSFTANRLGVIVERIQLAEVLPPLRLAVGSTIEFTGIASGEFSLLIDRPLPPQPPAPDVARPDLLVANLTQLQLANGRLGVVGGARAIVGTDHVSLAVSLAGLQPGSNYTISIDGVDIGQLTANRLGLATFRYDSRRDADSTVSSPLPAITSGTRIAVGQLTRATFVQITR